MKYYIVYFRTAYPVCRDAGGITKHRSKKCFEKEVCSETNCDSDCRSCTILPPQFHDNYAQVDERDYVRVYKSGYRGKYPFTCINSSCDESCLIEDCRCSIGKLSPKQKTGFEKEAEKLHGYFKLVRLDGINKLDKSSVFVLSSRIEKEIIEKKIVLGGPDVFALCSREELDLLEKPLQSDPSSSGYEAVIYRDSRERRYEKAKSNFRPVRPPHSPGPIQFMAECQELAKIINPDGDDANGKQSSPTESPSVKDTDTVSPEPQKVTISSFDKKAENQLHKVFVNAQSVFDVPKHETEAEKCDRLSDIRFGGAGWADLARISLKEDGKHNPSAEEIKTESKRIENLVKRLREKFQ